MNELEKAAERIALLYGKILDNQDWDMQDLDELLDLSCKDGMKWQSNQSSWISVEDAVPKESAKGLAKVKYLDGSEGEMLMEHISKWVYPYIKVGYITHWRPIPE